MSKAVIHIGGYKTGSTSIQRHLRINREHYLNANGYYYPFAGTKPPTAGHWEMARIIREGMNGTEGGEKAMLDLFGQLENECAELNTPLDTLMLSSEAFLPSMDVDKEFVDPMVFKKSPLFQDVKVIYYARPQAALAVSKFKQVIKHHHWKYRDMFDDFVARWRPVGRYHTVLAPWAEAFGLENITVRPYRRSALVNGDILDDFAQTVNFDRHDVDRDAAPSNVSPSLLASIILRDRRRSGNAPEDDREIMALLKRLDDRATDKERAAAYDSFMWHYRKSFEALEDYFAEDNAKLIKTYGLSDDFFG